MGPVSADTKLPFLFEIYLPRHGVGAETAIRFADGILSAPGCNMGVPHPHIPRKKRAFSTCPALHRNLHFVWGLCGALRAEYWRSNCMYDIFTTLPCMG